MLVEDDIKLTMNRRNIGHYRKLGYTVKLGDIITIKTSQLSKGAHNKVRVKCDYCGIVFRRVYKDYLKFKGKKVDKDSCSDCRPVKTRENNMANYGVESIRHVKEVNDKIEATNLERYGTKSPLENEEIRNKTKQTTLERYGVDNYFKIEGFKEIQKASMIEKYGYEHYMHDPEKMLLAVKKRSETMHKNSTAPSSRQQNYIHEIVGGKLNFPKGTLMLDIAFPDEKVYIEFQGSGHDLDVAMGRMTEKEFKRKDINRYYFLKSKGWKMIEIISKNDTLPYPEKLYEMLELSKKVHKDSSYIVFNLDDSTVKIKGDFLPYDFGETITQWEFRNIHESGRYDSFMNSLK